jgi:SAM-dependent methyltransferase
MLWPLRLISQAEVKAAATLLARVPFTRYGMADIGSGGGSLAAALRPEACVRIDRSWRMISAGSRAPGAMAICADLDALPLVSGHFHLVLAVGVAEYCRDPEPLIRQAVRILRRHGWLLFTVSPAGWHLRFRSLAGLPVYIHHEEMLSALFSRYRLTVKARNQTATQKLYLLQKAGAVPLLH